MSIYSKTTANRPRLSAFDLSYDKKFDCDMGELIPIMADEVVPGDLLKIGNQIVLRFQPLVAPILHEINCYVHYFFIPYRILWDKWEDFISGGKDGTDASVLPRWSTSINNEKFSLWDYFGFPTGVNPTGAYPLDFPRRAYNLVYNTYYRDENLEDEIALDSQVIQHRAWEKDYFSSALPWQQRGVAPALPISGTTSAHWSTDLLSGADQSWSRGVGGIYNEAGDTSPKWLHQPTTTGDVVHYHKLPAAALNGNSVDLSSATTFDVSDLRLAFQIQRWMEMNARGGSRYTEFLRAHFGVSPRDERLQRPEYLGGSKTPILVSEVLQTSSTDAVTPQGNLAGHGISVSGANICKYHATEFGMVLGLMSIMPRSAYMQGINRQWLRRTKYDFYFPEFAHLSEQGIENAEIYATGEETSNTGLFGYQGRYNEMRSKQSMVCGSMRDTFDYWHLAREFNSLPLLNASFIHCIPRKDVFAVQNEKTIMINMSNQILGIRPLPQEANPGLMDH